MTLYNNDSSVDFWEDYVYYSKVNITGNGRGTLV